MQPWNSHMLAISHTGVIFTSGPQYVTCLSPWVTDWCNSCVYTTLPE